MRNALTLCLLWAVVLCAPALAQSGARAAAVVAAVDPAAAKPGTTATLRMSRLTLSKMDFHVQSQHAVGREFYTVRSSSPRWPQNPSVDFGKPVYPKGKDENVPELLGKLNVYTDTVGRDAFQ